MKGSLLIMRIAGIGVFVHWTFLLLLGWIFVMHLPGEGVIGAFRGVGLIVALFGCVVLHELGHALTARRFDVPTKDITLLPIGGVARMERIPRNPNQELAIALAGPAVNVVIAAVLFVMLYAVGGPADLTTIASPGGPWLDKLMWFNVFVVVFNMLPAFPMDGGRVLRALLARRMNYVAATQVAANVGQIMAVFFAMLGLMSNWFLIFIALFVYLGARSEAELVRVQDLARGFTVRDAMVTQFDSLTPTHTIDEASRLLLAGSQHDFPVLDRGQVVGILVRQDLVNALATRAGRTSIESVMQTEFPILDEATDLEAALSKFQTPRIATIPVTHFGRLVGLLTQENLQEWVALGTARKRKQLTGPAVEKQFKDSGLWQHPRSFVGRP